MKKLIVSIAVSMLYFALAGNAGAIEAGPIEIHGFISQGYLYTSDNSYFGKDLTDGSFEFNEAGINFSSELTDKLHVGAQLFARDLAKYGNDELMLDWAFGDYRLNDWLGIRAGKMKIPFGLYNEYRDVDMLRNSVFLPSGVYNETFRDVFSGLQGAGIYGEIPYGFSYQLLYGTLDIAEDGGTMDTFANSFSNDFSTAAGTPISAAFSDIDVDYATAAYLQWDTPLDGLKLAASMYTTVFEGDLSTSLGESASIDYEQLGATTGSIEYTWDNLTLSAEYSQIKMDVKNGSTALLGGGLPAGTQLIDQTSEGYYGMASYRFTDWFELGTYYSAFYVNKDDRDGDRNASAGQDPAYAYLKDFALTTRFDINDSWQVKVEGHKMNGLFGCPFTADQDDDWYLLAVKTTFSF